MDGFEIDSLEFDDYNVEEIARHGVTTREVREVLAGNYRLLRNAKKHRAPYLMVGPTLGGRWLTVPIAPTEIPGTWRPATAFDASPGHITKATGGKRP
jgi:hypothetical protein